MLDRFSRRTMDTTPEVLSFCPHKPSKCNKISLLHLATTILIFGLLLSFTTPFWQSFLHFSKPSAKAASPLIRRIYIPYFNTPVPFDQTAIFWFGTVSSTTNYINVRMGYNKSELYIDLHIVDRFLWYDPNAKAPDLTKGDTATIYLRTAANGSSTPDRASYKFVAQLNWWQARTYYQQAFRGNGTGWTAASLPFSSVSGWRGHALNGPEASGWSMTYHLPFTSLALSGPPSKGSLWKLGVKVHNQDDAAGTPLPEAWWPESASARSPTSWGELVFGLPTYQPPQAAHTTSYTIRNKLNNQVVTDAMVGGALGCGQQGLNRWTQWGGLRYPGATRISVQDEWDISDWNCFSKIYITFPLRSLPSGKGVISAKVTMYENGNAGKPGQPNPSLIQVATVNEDWNPNTLTWNTAPLVQENISRTVVNTMSGPLVWPGQPYTWDVSKAVAEAYAAGQPLRLVFYSSDSAYHTAKYFTSSTIGDWDAQGRPTLKITLGV